MNVDARQISENIAHTDWLKQLRGRDVVLVRNGGLHSRAEVTDSTPCFLFIGKLKFRRDSGWQTTSQQRRVYRMKLRLVRNEKELQC